MVTANLACFPFLDALVPQRGPTAPFPVDVGCAKIDRQAAVEKRR